MKIKKEFVLREVAGEYILVPIGKTASEFNGLISVNEIGALIWNQLLEDKEVNDIVKLILDEYEIDEATASSDVLEFIQYLNDHNILGEND